eukprot:5619783-Prorocentrum_lima.AAC.1
MVSFASRAQLRLVVSAAVRAAASHNPLEGELEGRLSSVRPALLSQLLEAAGDEGPRLPGVRC